jgi:hypothetical protein
MVGTLSRYANTPPRCNSRWTVSGHGSHSNCECVQRRGAGTMVGRRGPRVCEFFVHLRTSRFDREAKLKSAAMGHFFRLGPATLSGVHGSAEPTSVSAPVSPSNGMRRSASALASGNTKCRPRQAVSHDGQLREQLSASARSCLLGTGSADRWLTLQR